MTTVPIEMGFNRVRLAIVADGLAVALAASLPWSVSVTSVLIVLWLVAVLPTLDVAALRRELFTAAGGIPAFLCLFAVAGMLWANAGWAERLDGLESFLKLLLIPVLFAQFRGSSRGHWTAIAFFVSCCALLLVSFALVTLPDLPWYGNGNGVPVKDYVSQSGMFTLCIFGAADRARVAWGERNIRRFVIWIVLGFAFLADILYVAASRTTLVSIPILVLLFGLKKLGWKSTIAVFASGAVILAVVWQSSPYLRQRVTIIPQEIERYQTENQRTSTGERLDFWRKSIRMIADAPLVGHGTGSIHIMFRKAAVGKSGVTSEVTTNPHNQTFGVAIQLGAVGTVLLYAMWLSHVLLFRGPGFASWIGFIVVVQNIVGSIFNSHLFDFTQGWTYVIGVGIFGGLVLGGTAVRSQGAPVQSS